MSEFGSLSVLRVVDLAPRFRRVTLGGAGFGAFAAGRSGPNIKLFLPRPEQAELVLPTRAADGSVRLPPLDQRPLVRTYTVRHFDRPAAALDIDFLLHGGGAATTWAANCRVGDTIGVGGIGGRGLSDADWLLLTGDDCAIPAIARHLEELPPEARGVAFVEVGTAEDEVPLPTRSAVEVRWLHRGSAPPGTTTRLEEAVRALRWPVGERVFAWVSGESATVRALRRHILDARGLERHMLLSIGYWKRGLAEEEYHAQFRNDREDADIYAIPAPPTPAPRR